VGIAAQILVCPKATEVHMLDMSVKALKKTQITKPRKSKCKLDKPNPLLQLNNLPN
jgi:hypothetical protein